MSARGCATARLLMLAALPIPACGRGAPAANANSAGPGGVSDPPRAAQAGPPSPPVDAPALGEGPWLRREGERYGYVDFSGTWVIPPTYAFALPFQSGLAAVQATAGSPVRYIDATGTSPFPLEFQDGTSFEQSVALVTTLDSAYALLTRAGSLILKGEVNRLCGLQVSEELILAAKGDECSVYDTTGRRILSAGDIDWISPVMDGRVLVATGVQDIPEHNIEHNIWAKHFAAYDLSGRLVEDFPDVAAVVLPGWSPLVAFSDRDWLKSVRSMADEGYVQVEFHAERSPGDGLTETGYIRFSGQRIHKGNHLEICCLSEGWIGFRDARDGDWGFETLAGDRKIPEADAVRPSGFSEGLLAVVQQTERGTQYVYIDERGAQAIPGTWAFADDFHEGRAVAAPSSGEGTEGGERPGGPAKGIIDRTGEWIVPPRFWIIDTFERGRHWTTATDFDGNSFVISRTGVVLPLPAYIPRD